MDLPFLPMDVNEIDVDLPAVLRDFLPLLLSLVECPMNHDPESLSISYQSAWTYVFRLIFFFRQVSFSLMLAREYRIFIRFLRPGWFARALSFLTNIWLGVTQILAVVSLFSKLGFTFIFWLLLSSYLALVPNFSFFFLERCMPKVKEVKGRVEASKPNGPQEKKTGKYHKDNYRPIEAASVYWWKEKIKGDGSGVRRFAPPRISCGLLSDHLLSLILVVSR